MPRKHYRHDPICPSCGEETATVIDGLCPDCQPGTADDGRLLVGLAEEWIREEQ